ncbi:hypothetical protein BDEG_23961 [Batrachochytrium dendrobatidis JEL423]|uniref:Uncharacterized protein n=1 Tax=Batrachochytrium dendrobatidis (strain JEL423) TaxID=403673 RepID=A0A177WJ94_BATDL|nr:hypothetical protein BDEG_23961 [Batrachochytrium dendrobatidis JEL423]
MKEEFPDYQIGDVDFKDKTCFNDFDGELHFLNSERPYMRCLSFHALLAREHALDYGWIDENELKELDVKNYIKTDIMDRFYKGNGKFHYSGLMQIAVKTTNAVNMDTMNKSL